MDNTTLAALLVEEEVVVEAEAAEDLRKLKNFFVYIFFSYLDFCLNIISFKYINQMICLLKIYLIMMEIFNIYVGFSQIF